MASLYIHNEFINTWVYLLPACFFLWILATGSWIGPQMGGTIIARIDLLPVQLYIACTAACLLLSVSQTLSKSIIIIQTVTYLIWASSTGDLSLHMLPNRTNRL